MILSAIVAVAENGVIGKDGGLPWRLPAEMAYFKDKTMGHPIIMGRKTLESIGRSLPGRLNVVISRNPDFQPAEGSILVNSMETALNLEGVKSADEVFILGGKTIYDQAMPLLNKLYLTKIHANVDGDTFFTYDPKQWQLVSSDKHAADNDNHYAYDFLVLERKK